MIRVRQVKVPIGFDDLKERIVLKLKVNVCDIDYFKINKKSIDARHKDNICVVYEVDVQLKNEDKYLKFNKNKDIVLAPLEKFEFKTTGSLEIKNRIVIVGSGPAGLFAGYVLAENGYNPLIIERGSKMEERILKVDEFWENGNLDLNTNVQFGEGGAGTFSDGKLNTLVKDKEFIKKKVLEIFVENGAPSDILYLNKPHIGTDKLRDVIVNMRKNIQKNGGEFLFDTCLTDIVLESGKLKSIVVNDCDVIFCDALILAIGHSSRDTFRMLYDKGVIMNSKPFAVGVRISHPQSMIDASQYGSSDSRLGPASYKLTYTTTLRRGVYSFCMCPGGYVVNSSSSRGMLSINGMSNYARDTLNANSAIVVTVTPDDFGGDPLDGIRFQEALESRAYDKGYGNIPVQLLKDFKDNTISTSFGDVKPIFKGEYSFTNINEILPDYICLAIKEAMPYFETKIKGFNRDDAIVAALESRTSSPVRFYRDDFYESNIKGIYPCGEGAGYAGGITTSAMDGIKVARSIASVYKKIVV